ncbi:MAG: hypothetical protein ACLR0U_08355 [Enterocloster clostridioformis]
MGRKKKEYVECVLFTLPAIVLVMITIYIPFVMSGYYSLMEWNGISKKPVFIGLKNFTQMFAGSSDFVRSLVFTGKVYGAFHALYQCTGNRSCSGAGVEDKGCECYEEHVFHSLHCAQKCVILRNMRTSPTTTVC